MYIANISKHILRFHLPYLKWLQDNGYETHVAANGEEEIPFCNVKHNVPIDRSPFSLRNIMAHKILKKIIEENNFVLVHGHTPMGGVLARTASASSRGKGTKVLYTAHGFHFFKGAPLKNWLLYYPIEKYLAFFTDGIITINEEDYNILSEKKFKSLNNFYIKGIGVDSLRFTPIDDVRKKSLREEMGYSCNQFILVYVGEFIPRKNHKFIIDSTLKLSQLIPEIKVLFAGRGQLLDQMKCYAAEKGLSSFIDFLGFRSDIQKVMSIADVGISSSKHEGLGLNLAEEMFLGLPIVATQDRGHREMIKHNFNGFLFEQNNAADFIKYIDILYQDQELRYLFGIRSLEKSKEFSLENSLQSMAEIYNQFL